MLIYAKNIIIMIKIIDFCWIIVALGQFTIGIFPIQIVMN